MGHRGRIAVLPCLILTLAGAASQTVSPPPPSAMVPPPASDLQEDDGRIVGGIAADPNSAPWQAEIYSTYAYTADDLASDARLPPDERAYLAARSPWERAHRCGAVYIGDGWLLSAAHCFAGIRADPLTGWRIRLGAYDLSRSDDGVTYAIERVAVHRGFTGAAPYADDIALLHVVADTRTRARPDAPVQAIRLAGPNDRPIAAYEWLRVTGWGSTKPRDAVPGALARDGSINHAAVILQQIDIRLQTPACATVPAYRAV